MVDDTRLPSCFPRKSGYSFKIAARRSSRGSAADKEIRVYIQDDDHNKENIEHRDSIEKTSSARACLLDIFATEQ